MAERIYAAARAASFFAAPAAHVQLRRPAAAPPLGQHGNEGPAGLGRSVREGARRPADREHDAGEDAERSGHLHGAGPDRWRLTAASARACSRSSPRRESMSMPSRPVSRTRARSRSWRRGTTLMAVIGSKSAALTGRMIQDEGVEGSKAPNESAAEGSRDRHRRDRCQDPGNRPDGAPEVPVRQNLTPDKMVADVKKLAKGWEYDVVSIGYPGPVREGRPAIEPRNLARGWLGFDFRDGLRSSGEGDERRRDAGARELPRGHDALPRPRDGPRIRPGRARAHRPDGARPSRDRREDVRGGSRGPRTQEAGPKEVGEARRGGHGAFRLCAAPRRRRARRRQRQEADEAAARMPDGRQRQRVHRRVPDCGKRRDPCSEVQSVEPIAATTALTSDRPGRRSTRTSRRYAVCTSGHSLPTTRRAANA